jgi:hypothetical protein
MARGHLFPRRTFLLALAGGAVPILARRAAPSQVEASSTQRWPAVGNLIGEWVAARKIAGGAAALSFDDAPFAYVAAGGIALDSPTAFDENDHGHRRDDARRTRKLASRSTSRTRHSRVARATRCG